MSDPAPGRAGPLGPPRLAQKPCAVSAAPIHDVVRHRDGRAPETSDDLLAVEEPLEIRLNTRSLSVTMRTPGHDEELAAGFLLTEGLLHTRADLAELAPCKTTRPEGKGNILNATLAPHLTPDFAKLTRHVFASSSCGLCGKASIANLHQQFPPIPAASESPPFTVSLDVLRRLPHTLRAAQDTFTQTGGLHAAGIFDLDGNLLVAREDVGRHNAVDKVIGHGLLAGHAPFSRHILLVSGRASFEIVQKALAARFPILAAVSAPSSLAVDFARANGQTLVGFLRDTSLNVYTHPGRIGIDEP
ncbi:MAG: formate dehydrogenase accessory sulfurtransferase FdhD [Burkholderiales bacterium]|nr:formate dehydrogenase accessory sulfurtransferase FdhD [Opitutaceae bacterium]